MPELNDSMELYYPLAIACMVLGFCIQCAILCCRNVARTSPTNYIMLGIFTLCWTFLIGFICASYDAAIVVASALMTAVITITLTIYAFTTKSDFT